MMENWSDIQIEVVDRILSGRGSKEDHELLQKWRIQSDVFAKQLEAYNEVHDSLSDQSMQEFLTTLHRVHHRAQPKRRILPLWIRAAAAVLILATAALYFWQPTSWEHLVAQYTPQKVNLSLRVASSEQERIWGQIEDAYNSDNFDVAIPLMKEQLKIYPDNYSLQLYLGQALYYNGLTDQAELEFSSIAQNENVLNSLRDEARWWQAMTLLKKQDKTQLTSILQFLTRSDNSHLADRSRSLLEELDHVD